jgi:hypothetical protein
LTTPASRKLWLGYAVAMLWLYVLLWPLIGIKPEGLEFAGSFAIGQGGPGLGCALGILSAQAVRCVLLMAQSL